MARLGFDFALPKGWMLADLYAYEETNYNGIVGKRVKFDNTYRADLKWSLPFEAGLPLTWNASIDVIGTKGKDGFGHGTKTETRVFTELGRRRRWLQGRLRLRMVEEQVRRGPGVRSGHPPQHAAAGR